MKLLAVDTTTVACSVALQCGAQVHARHAEQPRAHTRLLLPMIRDVLDEAGIAVPDLDGCVLGNGPGSFIGMRIGTAVVQGIAHAAGIGIVPVSSLQVIAEKVFAETDAAAVAVCQDAHMEEVSLAAWRRAADAPTPCIEARLQAVDTIPDLPADCVAAGHGWARYPALLEANQARIVSHIGVDYPDARYALTAGLREIAAGRTIAPDDVEPAYLRDRVAVPAAEAP